MSRTVRIKNVRESTITFLNFKLILRGKSTGQGQATVSIENVHQESELNGLEKIGYISIEDLDATGKSKNTSKSQVSKKELTSKELEKDSERVIIMTNAGPNEIKKTLNSLLDIPDDARTQKSIEAAKAYDKQDDYIEDYVKHDPDMATVALGNNKFEKVEIKHSILPQVKKNTRTLDDTSTEVVKKSSGVAKKSKQSPATSNTNKKGNESKPKSIKAVGTVREKNQEQSQYENDSDLLFTTQSPNPDCFVDT